MRARPRHERARETSARATRARALVARALVALRSRRARSLVAVLLPKKSSRSRPKSARRRPLAKPFGVSQHHPDHSMRRRAVFSRRRCVLVACGVCLRGRAVLRLKPPVDAPSTRAPRSLMCVGSASLCGQSQSALSGNRARVARAAWRVAQVVCFAHLIRLVQDRTFCALSASKRLSPAATAPRRHLPAQMPGLAAEDKKGGALARARSSMVAVS